jgi:sugar transport system permease protein
VTAKEIARTKGAGRYQMELIILGLIILIALVTPHFFSLENLLNILQNISLQGVIAFGMTMVIIAGEIDLSIASTVALSGVVTALVTGRLAKAGILPLESAVLVGMAAAILLCAVFGLLIGIIRVRFKIPTFIVTLAMMNVMYGIAGTLTKGFPITTLPIWFNDLGAGHIFSLIPIPAIMLLVVFLIVYALMTHTTFGRAIYAVGGNEESARLCGINIGLVKIVVMVLVQVLAAVGGILVSSQVMSGSHTFGKGYELNVIAAVIIGGTSLSGGKGRPWGTFIGLIFLGVIINAMILLDISEFIQYIVKGVLILFAVLLNSIQQNRE